MIPAIPAAYLPSLVWTWVVLSQIAHVVQTCSFPDSLVMAREDPPWYSHVMDDGSRKLEYYIRRSVMEIHFARGDRTHVRWKCVMSLKGKLLLKRQDHNANVYYKCARIHIRSPSVVQFAWSDESNAFDIGHCDDDLLHLDPWLLVKYETLESDFSQCPFSGGYNLKITDSQLGENGCNLMHRPMRLEVDCVGGEGAVFDFTSKNCVPDIKMHSKQQTLCVASWHHRGNHFSVLRKPESDVMWCLVVPVHRGTELKAYLFSDLTCRGDSLNNDESNIHQGSGKRRYEPLSSLKYFTLDLHQRNFPTLCEDEYSQCSTIECNDYFKQECQKSCHACNGTSRVKSCMFPKRFKGAWFLKYANDFRHVEMKETELTIQGVGHFQCAAFPDSPSRKSRIYSTVSVYDNGCRPRYTCVKLQRVAPSVIRYSLSQSYIWPALQSDFGKTICEPDRFQADQAPVEDFYRSHSGSAKAVIAQRPDPVPVNCNLSTVLTLTATLPEGFVCTGSMFTHCEDQTKIRLYFGSCSGLIDTVSDYRCLANYEGHYWERILLVQNLRDDADAICFVFNKFKPNEAYVMVAGQCDQESFNFARAGVRKPILTLKFREETETCQSIPPPVESPVSLEDEGRLASDSKPLASGHSSSYKNNNNRTHADQGHPYQSPSVIVTISPSEKSHHHKQGEAGEAVSQPKTDYGTRKTSHNTGNDVSIWRAHRSLVLVLVCISCVIHRLIQR